MASLLLSGIGMHAHEYSQQQEPVNAPAFGRLPYPLARSAFSAPIAKLPLSTLRERHSTTIKPIRPLSEELPRNNQHIPVVHFEEPILESMSENDLSTSERSLGGNTLGGGVNQTTPVRRRRRSVRTSTTFQLAQPAPTLSAKQRLLQIRPKLLLQLQQLPSNSRPIPAIDVLPSTQVVPRLIKRFPRMFRGKNKLGANDVMIMKCEEYEEEDSYGATDNEPDEESLSGRELLAVICQMPRDLGGSRGTVEIVLKDGSVWTATPSENGLQVDFETVDDHGGKTTARWVKDKKITRRSTGIDMARPTSALSSTPEFRFTFSIIDPTKRQHPIIATMTHTTLDIPDTYTARTSSFESVPPLSMPTSHESLDGGTEDDSVRNTFPVDNELRSLVQVTGIYVALSQGVSSYFKYSELPSCSSRPSPSFRAVTSNPTPDPTQSGTPDFFPGTPDSNQVGTLAVLSGKYRDRLSPSNSVSGFDHPRRSMSAGGSYMQRALGRKTANLPSTIISDSEGEKGTMQSLNGVGINDNSTSTTLLHPSIISAPSTPTKAPRWQGQSLSSHRQSEAEPLGLGIQHGGAVSQLQQTQNSRHKRSRWKSFMNIFRRRSNKRSLK